MFSLTLNHGSVWFWLGCFPWEHRNGQSCALPVFQVESLHCFQITVLNGRSDFLVKTDFGLTLSVRLHTPRTPAWALPVLEPAEVKVLVSGCKRSESALEQKHKGQTRSTQ